MSRYFYKNVNEYRSRPLQNFNIYAVFGVLVMGLVIWGYISSDKKIGDAEWFAIIIVPVIIFFFYGKMIHIQEKESVLSVSILGFFKQHIAVKEFIRFVVVDRRSLFFIQSGYDLKVAFNRNGSLQELTLFRDVNKKKLDQLITEVETLWLKGKHASTDETVQNKH